MTNIIKDSPLSLSSLFLFTELDQLILAYAITIHKSKSSEYKISIIIVSPEHLSTAKHHLIYTTMTRGTDEFERISGRSAEAPANKILGQNYLLNSQLLQL